MTDGRYLATCPKGLASLLAPELTSLGALSVRETVAGVEFTGPLAVAYRACLQSRFANRVLLQLSEFAIDGADDLYEGVLRLPWHEHVRPDGSLAVDFAGSNGDIRNTRFGAQRCKDAIVDGFRARGLSRPSVDTRHPDIRVNVRLWRGKVTVALDLSGGSLHRRGYRTDPGKAPLKENLAAAVLARAGWPERLEQGWTLVDPMCGSGTLLIEAAMMAMRHAPGLRRDRHGFEEWLGHNPSQWNAIVAAAKDQCREAPEGVEIRGYDGDIRAVRRTEEIIAELGLQKLVRVRAKGLNELTRPSHRAMPEGLLVSNPPWGERIGDKSALTHLYRQLGEVMHREFQGWQAGILTSDKALGRAIGLRSHRQYAFNNGAIDVSLLLFDLSADNRLAEAAGPRSADPTAPDPWRSARPAADLSPGAAMFANRLKKNLAKLAGWVRREQVHCYRIYDADMPEYAVAVDLYEGQPHVAEYAAPKSVDPEAASRRLEEALSGVRAALGLAPDSAIAVKRRQRQKGSQQYVRQSQTGERIVVREGGARLLVNLHDYLDTGLFLDHRPLRLCIAEEAKGKHFLNLFCYTGSATVQAALGGATTSTSVDLSNTYLAWMRENLALNGLSERQHRTVRANCVEWLGECDRQYDLILLDPPSFSNSKATADSFDVQRDQRVLLERAMRVLSPKGVLYFSNNRRGFQLDPALSERFNVVDISRETIPEDFKRRPDIHQCWRFEHH